MFVKGKYSFRADDDCILVLKGGTYVGHYHKVKNGKRSVVLFKPNAQMGAQALTLIGSYIPNTCKHFDMWLRDLKRSGDYKM